VANCLVLLNDGASNILLNDGASQVLLNDDSCDGGEEPSGGLAGIFCWLARPAR
jgi:hypothetical protein